MNHARRRFLQAATGTALLAVTRPIADAQSYSARSVRMIVPFAPGGMVDTAGRLIAQKLSEHFGRQYYVENVAGRRRQHRPRPRRPVRSRWIHAGRVRFHQLRGLGPACLATLQPSHR